MKTRIIASLTVALFLLPHTTFAAWWSPSTWKVFQPAPQTSAKGKAVVPPPQQSNSSDAENLKSTVEKNIQKKETSKIPVIQNVKKAPIPVKKTVTPAKKSLEKKIDNSGKKPSVVKVPMKIEGENKKDQALPSQSAVKTQPISSDGNIKEKIKYVVQIVCPINGGTSSGTGSIVYGFSNSDSKILTNKHVLDGAIGPCGVYRTENYASSPVLYFQSGRTFIFSKEYDLAVLTPDVTTLNTYASTNFQFNQGTDVFDSNIWVLGYPPSAGNNITLTKGVISGSENVKGIIMYKTDAKIDSGNSGGAVFDEDGKLLGVPTLASQGNFSSYGYIVPAHAVKIFLDLVEQEGYGKQNWQHPEISLYTASPSNIFPDVSPRIQQGPTPDEEERQRQEEQNKQRQLQQQNAQLAIEKCKVQAATIRDNFLKAISQLLEQANAPIQKFKDAIKKQQNGYYECRMETTPAELRILTPDQQNQLRESNCSSFLTNKQRIEQQLAEALQRLQQLQDNANKQADLGYNETYSKCINGL